MRDNWAGADVIFTFMFMLCVVSGCAARRHDTAGESPFRIIACALTGHELKLGLTRGGTFKLPGVRGNPNPRGDPEGKPLKVLSVLCVPK